MLEGGKTVTNLAFAREVLSFLFGESVCSAVSGLALGDLSDSLPVSIKMMKTPYPGGTPLGAEVNISSYSGARGDCLIFFHVQLYSN